MIHLILASERRASREAKYEARRVEAAKDPANVKWLVRGIGQIPARFAVESDAVARKAALEKNTVFKIVIEKEVFVPADPQARMGVDPVKIANGKLPAQIHTVAERIDDVKEENILYAAEWDGKSPWITVHKGKIADLKMAYLGWPMVTQDEWEAEHP